MQERVEKEATNSNELMTGLRPAHHTEEANFAAKIFASNIDIFHWFRAENESARALK